MRRNLITASVVAVFLGLAVTQAMMFSRVRALQEQVADLKRAPVPPPVEREKAQPAAGDPAVAPWAEAAPVPELVPAPESPSREPSLAGPVTAPASLDPQAPVTAGQVEDIVKKVLEERERRNERHFGMDGALEELLTSMEKEMNLTASQKARIQEHMKVLTDSMQQIFQSRESPEKTREQSRQVWSTYQANVKSELDNVQQQKYDQMVRDRRFFRRMTPRGEGGGGDRPPPR